MLTVREKKEVFLLNGANVNGVDRKDYKDLSNQQKRFFKKVKTLLQKSREYNGSHEGYKAVVSLNSSGNIMLSLSVNDKQVKGSKLNIDIVTLDNFENVINELVDNVHEYVCERDEQRTKHLKQRQWENIIAYYDTYRKEEKPTSLDNVSLDELKEEKARIEMLQARYELQKKELEETRQVMKDLDSKKRLSYLNKIIK